MAIDELFAQRLQERVAQDAANFRRNEREKGINAYARHTQTYLAKFGLDGFPNSMIGRWVTGKIDAQPEADTLKRLGIIWGLGRIDPDKDPDDPNNVDGELALEQAYLWLNGRDPNSAVPSEVISPDPVHSIINDIQGVSSIQLLRDIAIAAMDRLVEVAESSSIVEEEKEMKPTPLTYMLEGWMSRNEADEAELARTLQTTTARVDEILNGAVLTKSECEAIAKLTDLQVSTLEAWGAGCSAY